MAPDDNGRGFTFNEVGFFRASTNKVVCCHFSSDGKLLATGGLDKKAVVWHTDSLRPKIALEEHSLLITDVRFSPSMSRLATSSFDKTVRVWDADNPGYSLRTFTGHSAAVMSVDFHPIKEDLICSCDRDGEIRYWSFNRGSCARVFKQGRTFQMRIQPRLGRYLAAASDNVVSILDVETQACIHSLQGHTNSVHSVCWDPSGDLLASVSEDSVRVWTLGSGSEGECVHELSCNGNKFHSCVFHPAYPSLLVIGCYQSLELWNMVENKTMTLPAHEGIIAALAVSNVTGLVASASHDKFVKLWNCVGALEDELPVVDVEVTEEFGLRDRPFGIVDTDVRKTRRSTIRLVKVQWSDDEKDVTWETEDKILKKYPYLLPPSLFS